MAPAATLADGPRQRLRLERRGSANIAPGQFEADRLRDMRERCQSARDHGDSELRVLRGAPAVRIPSVRTRRGHPDRRQGTCGCADGAGSRRRDRPRPDQGERGRKTFLSPCDCLPRVSPFRAVPRDANGTVPVITSPNPPIMRRGLVLPLLERGTFRVAGGADRGADREPPAAQASSRGPHRGSRDTTNQRPAGQDEPKEST